MHHEALKLLHRLVEESKSNQVQPEVIQKLKPESIVEYLKVHFLFIDFDFICSQMFVVLLGIQIY